MNDFQKRFLMFIFGCIVVRSIIAYIAKVMNPEYLPYVAVIFLIGAIRFIYLYFTNPKGPQFLGKDIWWNNIRPIHFVLYLSFAVSAFMKKSYAWVFLAVDVVVALSSFIIFHSINGDWMLLIK